MKDTNALQREAAQAIQEDMNVKVKTDKLKPKKDLDKKVMVNARINKADWEKAVKVLRARNVTWADVCRDVVKQLIESK